VQKIRALLKRNFSSFTFVVTSPTGNMISSMTFMSRHLCAAVTVRWNLPPHSEYFSYENFALKRLPDT
jgi:hypothetical protein